MTQKYLKVPPKSNIKWFRAVSKSFNHILIHFKKWPKIMCRYSGKLPKFIKTCDIKLMLIGEK
jgi:hypothetical protein